MSDLSEEDLREYSEALHPVVKASYEREVQYAEAHIKSNMERGQSWIQEALTWVPYIDSIFDEEVGRQAAISDINISQRVAFVIQNIEAGLGESLSAQTKRDVQEDVYGIWGFSWSINASF